MTSIIFFIIFIPVLGIILLSINFLLAPHKPYKEKKTPFECGFHSFVGQNRKQFSVIFFIYSIMFMIFDLELFFAFPLGVSIAFNDALGITVLVIFFLILTLGFVFELGSNALNLDTKQIKSSFNLENINWNRIAVFILIAYVFVFKYTFKIVFGCSEDEILFCLAICFIASTFSCLVFVVKCFLKNDYNCNLSKLTIRFIYTFFVTMSLHILLYFDYINIDADANVLLLFVSWLCGVSNGAPLTTAPFGDKDPSSHILKMEGNPSSSGQGENPSSAENKWKDNSKYSTKKLDSADVIEQISDTGFIDEKHMQLLSKVQDPEEGTSFKEFQQNVQELKDYVKNKGPELGKYAEHWANRDRELIDASRAMYANELTQNKFETLKKRVASDKDAFSEGSNKKRHEDDKS